MSLPPDPDLGTRTGTGTGTGTESPTDWRPHVADPSARPASPLPHVVFFEPRIPGNTGNAIRLAAVTGSRLHLVEPLGFDLDEPKLRRAGLDYHDLAAVEVHADLDAALTTLPGRVFAFTTRATTSFVDVEYRPDDVLTHPRVTDQLKIPMLPGRRSLNLTNAASVAVYEAWRQAGFAGGA